jgi:hypothetical protein
MAYCSDSTVLAEPLRQDQAADDQAPGPRDRLEVTASPGWPDDQCRCPDDHAKAAMSTWLMHDGGLLVFEQAVALRSACQTHKLQEEGPTTTDRLEPLRNKGLVAAEKNRSG